MTIKRGQEWGTRVISPPHFPVLTSDAAVALHPSEKLFALSGGDLWRTLGKPSAVRPGEPCTEVRIDAIEITVTRPNGSVVRTVAASSVEVGTLWGRGGFLAVLNSGFLGDLNLVPRSHPNDGRLEVFEMKSGTARMQRLMIRRRARSGSHLPHPAITVNSACEFKHSRRGTRSSLRADGRDLGAWATVSIVCLPDHWRLLL